MTPEFGFMDDSCGGHLATRTLLMYAGTFISILASVSLVLLDMTSKKIPYYKM